MSLCKWNALIITILINRNDSPLMNIFNPHWLPIHTLKIFDAKYIVWFLRLRNNLLILF